MTVDGLEIRDLYKSFGTAPVVRGLALSLAKGEIVSLLGPSGCGKTTALRMVAGLERPDRGEIAIGGRTMWSDRVNVPPEKRAIGMVFQSYAVWPHRSVRDNVAYPLRLKRDPRAHKAADEAIALVRLNGLGDRFPETLSGGQQQRVALARALVSRPELLLFDEPLSNLDAHLREEMRHELSELARRVGITTLYVTHDQPEAFAVSDRVAVVLEGRVAQVAAPAELYRTPTDLRVAGFVGRLSILAQVERAPGDRAIIGGSLSVPATLATSAISASDCVAGVRPEDVDLVNSGLEDALAGIVVRATFLGERIEAVIETTAGHIRADLDPVRSVAKGDHVRVSLRECRLFAAEERRG